MGKDNNIAGYVCVNDVTARDLQAKDGTKKRGYQINLSSIQFGFNIRKIAINIEILNKPDKLSDEEFNEIKKHPMIGAEIISAISYLDIVKVSVKFHHIWYNGEGYPGIHLNEKKSKIIANIIRKKRSQFDPKAIDILINQIDNNKVDRSGFIKII